MFESDHFHAFYSANNGQTLKCGVILRSLLDQPLGNLENLSVIQGCGSLKH